MRIWTEVSATARAINRLADSIRTLASSVTELARVMKVRR